MKRFAVRFRSVAIVGIATMAFAMYRALPDAWSERALIEVAENRIADRLESEDAYGTFESIATDFGSRYLSGLGEAQGEVKVIYSDPSVMKFSVVSRSRAGGSTSVWTVRIRRNKIIALEPGRLQRIEVPGQSPIPSRRPEAP